MVDHRRRGFSAFIFPVALEFSLLIARIIHSKAKSGISVVKAAKGKKKKKRKKRKEKNLILFFHESERNKLSRENGAKNGRKRNLPFQMPLRVSMAGCVSLLARLLLLLPALSPLYPSLQLLYKNH